MKSLTRFGLAICVFLMAVGWAKADWGVLVSPSPAAITVPSSQGGNCLLTIRQVSPVSDPYAAFTIWTGAVMSGPGTVVPAHGSFSFACAGSPFAANQTVGWVKANSAGVYPFNVAASQPTPPSSGMTWPAGGAGIPNYGGSSTWGTSYGASNPIPFNFLATTVANNSLSNIAGPTAINQDLQFGASGHNIADSTHPASKAYLNQIVSAGPPNMSGVPGAAPSGCKATGLLCVWGNSSGNRFYQNWNNGTDYPFLLPTDLTWDQLLSGTALSLAAVMGHGSSLDIGTSSTNTWGTNNANGFFQTALPNDSGTPTVAAETACENSSGNVQACGVNVKSHLVGACVSGCGGTGYPKVAIRGNVASLTFDATHAVVVGDWVVSSATAGLVADTGSTTYPTCGNQPVGIATTAGLASTVQSVLLRPDALPPCLTANQYLGYLSPASIGGSRPACSTLSDSAPSCNTDTTNASNLGSGTVPAARLPIGAGFAYGAGAGTANAQTVSTTVGPPYTALTNGVPVAWLPTAANSTTTPTLAVNGLTAKTITKCGQTALVANDLITTEIAIGIYDGTDFELLNPAAGVCGSSNATNGFTFSLGVTFSTTAKANTAFQSPLFEAPFNGDVIYLGGQSSASAAGFVNGGAYFLGGDETGATGANGGGFAMLRGGVTTSTSGFPGITEVAQGFFKGTTVTLWNLQCMTSTAFTVNDCGTSAADPIGPASNITNPITVLVGDGTEAPINSDNATTVGHTVCTSTTAGGQIHDSGGVAACALGTSVGVVVSNSGSVVLGTGASKSTVTLGSTLPLVFMRFD